MTNKESAIKLAAKLLQISIEEANEYGHVIDDIDAMYFSIPIKGGDSLIVSNNGEVLYANSSVSYDDHVNEFHKCTRTPLDAFQV